MLDSPSPAPGPRTLLGRLRAAVRARHYSPRTEQAYVAWVRRYVQFHGRRHPAVLGATEVQAFLTHLAERERVSASSRTRPRRSASRPSARHGVGVERKVPQSFHDRDWRAP